MVKQSFKDFPEMVICSFQQQKAKDHHLHYTKFEKYKLMSRFWKNVRMYKQVSVPYTMSEVSSNVAVSTKCAQYPKMDDSQSCSCQMDPRMDIVEMHENLVHSPNSPFIPPPFSILFH